MNILHIYKDYYPVLGDIKNQVHIAQLIAYGLIGVQELLWKSFIKHMVLLSLAAYGLLIIYSALADSAPSRQLTKVLTLGMMPPSFHS